MFLRTVSEAGLPPSAGLGCAITFPAPGVTILQGRTVRITGTISRAATVAVSVGSISGAAATVSGFGWYYDYSPASGDVGSPTITAHATDSVSHATGDAGPVSIIVQAAFDKSASLLYVPASSITGSPGASIGTVPSVYGSSSLVPSPTAPTVVANAVGGNNGAWYPNDGAPYQYFTCNPLASSLLAVAGSWTVVLHNRLDHPGDHPLMALLRSDIGTTEELWIRSTSESLTVKRTSGGTTQTLTAARSPDPYSDTMIAVRCNAGVITIFERSSGKTTEAISSAGMLSGIDLSAAANCLTFGASVWGSLVGELMGGFQNGWGIWASALTDTNIHDIFNEWQFDNYLVTQTNGLGAMSPGDSVLVGPGDQVTGGGMRDFVSDFWSREGLSFYSYGGIQAGGTNNGYGEGRLGLVRNTFTSCLSGQNIAQICTQALLDIANSPTPVRYWLCYMGGADNNFLTPPATIKASYIAGFSSVMDAMIATEVPGGSLSFASISPIIPIEDTSIQANCVAFYAVWPSIVSSLQSKYPGRVYAGDMFAAMGGVAQVPRYFNNDATGLGGHPNRAGYGVMMLDPVNGMLNAKNEIGERLGQRFRRASPSAARPVALSGTILTPSTGASIAHGSTQTFTFDCSRMASTPRLKVDGITKGIGTALDSLDFVAFLGAYVHRAHNTFTFDWVTGAGDVGAHTVTVEFTDVDVVTVAVSAGIAFTVT